MRLLLGTAILALPAVALAQSPTCGDSTVHFEYQLSRPARWLEDTTLAVHPTAATRAPANLVQFVVDTLGLPEPKTFRALKIADSVLVAEARPALPSWRYMPGVLDGCRVRQLVQTPIRR
jgi:hypothetical protein